MFSSPLQVPSPGFPIEAMRLITARIGKLMAMMPSKSIGGEKPVALVMRFSTGRPIGFQRR
jgi:hypothetical protein